MGTNCPDGHESDEGARLAAGLHEYLEEVQEHIEEKVVPLLQDYEGTASDRRDPVLVEEGDALVNDVPSPTTE